MWQRGKLRPERRGPSDEARGPKISTLVHRDATDDSCECLKTSLFPYFYADVALVKILRISCLELRVWPPATFMTGASDRRSTTAAGNSTSRCSFLCFSLFKRCTREGPQNDREKKGKGKGEKYASKHARKAKPVRGKHWYV